MKQNSIHFLALTGLAVLSLVPGLRAETPLVTPILAEAVTPLPKPANATGMVEKNENAVIKTALQPLRDKLVADRSALKDAKASGDQAKIDAAKATVKADLRAIHDKRVSMEHDRRALGQAAKEGRDKDKDDDKDEKKEKRELKSDAHREKAEDMKEKAHDRQ